MEIDVLSDMGLSVLSLPAFWFVIGLAAFFLIAGYRLWRQKHRRREPEGDLQASYPQAHVLGFRSVALPELSSLAFYEQEPTWSAQSPGWQSAMAEVGGRYQALGVGAIYLVHGTFAGTDPTGLLSVVEKFQPQLAQQLARLIKRSTDRLMGDMGNFTEAYSQLLEQSLASKLQVHRYHWSSENNHAARFRAALVLIAELAALPRSQRQKRLICMGHSHAGQVFAILESLRQGLPGYMAVIHEFFPEQRLDIQKQLRLMEGLSIHYVTLGTPPRYPWPQQAEHRILNIINHRGADLDLQGIYGLLTTRSGDYVQAFGLAGSDTLSVLKQERLLAQRLDVLLGAGVALGALRSQISFDKRPLNPGYSFLVDFQDQGRLTPNCLATIFGHGCYTKLNWMLWLQQATADYLESCS